jgi:ribosomal protein S18 acetylase RimI-like enzyme
MIVRRPEMPEDEDFLRRCITLTVCDELGASDWPAPLRDAVLTSQYAVRRQSARNGNGRASEIILVDGAPAGWICTADLGREVRIAELMVLPEHRGKRVGAAVVQDVIEHAGNRPVRLNVNVTNARAVRFYQRLGFARVGGDEVQHAMEHPGAAAC